MNTYSLLEILSKEITIENGDHPRSLKFDGIRIPIIQRDYAHGRADEKTVRTRFLDSLFTALKNESVLELDFVYGSIQTLNRQSELGIQKQLSYFVPLDGQQRLTTLFLLYWYIGNRECQGASLETLRETLSRFSYATRATSARFCQRLSRMDLGTDPGNQINEAIWFHDGYKQDPTVRSMLRMIREIQRYYDRTETGGLFARLENLRFYILPLDGFDLSDELYIKMNGRGKQLTDFENLKADLVNWMSEDKSSLNGQFHTQVNYQGHDMPYYLMVSSKIDNDWTGIFWKDALAEPEEEDRIVDPAFMRFFLRLLLTQYIAKNGIGVSQLETAPLFTAVSHPRYHYNGLMPFIPLLESIFPIQDFQQIMDRYTPASEEIATILAPSWDNTQDWKLSAKSINLRQYALFYGVMAYLRHNDFDREKFGAWLRVVWNLIIDPELRRNTTMFNFIRLVDQLSAGSNDIIDYLSSDSFPQEYESELDYNSYESAQLYEERVKALLIKADSRFAQEFILAESHPRLKGKIFFLLQQLEQTNLEDFIQERDLALKILGDPEFETASRWIRATMALNDSLDIRLSTGHPLSLNNDQENWRHLINNDLRRGFIKLVRGYDPSTPLTDYLKGICAGYPYRRDLLWLYNLITFEEKGHSLLDYSESKKLVRYAFWDDDSQEREKVFLFNKNIWTDSNIMLSNLRNQLIRESLNHYPLKHEWLHGNLYGKFFRGKIVDCFREVNGHRITYRFTLNTLMIGLLEDPATPIEPNADIPQELRIAGWVVGKKYNFAALRELDEIALFLANVEQELFTKDDPDSLVNILTERIGSPNEASLNGAGT